MFAKQPTDLTNNEKQGSTEMSVRGQKSLKNKQLDILVTIDNKNIQQNVKDLLEKFDPPICKNCSNRRADRVCVNKACGPSKYGHIICGRCHTDSHSKATNKPELDIEEYLTRFAQFLNEEQLKTDTKKMQTFDIDRLNASLDDIQIARNSLNLLKRKIERHVEGFETPEQGFSNMLDCVTKALSLCEYNNIRDQLSKIKKRVIFEQNKFQWNNASKQFDELSKEINHLGVIESNLKNNIANSLSGEQSFNLNELSIRWNLSTASFSDLKPSIQGQDNKISIGGQSFQRQLFLDHQLDPEQVYRLRFTFLVNPKAFNIVGIMPISVVSSQWVCSSQGNTLYKFFFHSGNTDCNNIIKGIDLNNTPVQGSQIEMRVDMKNGYIDFSDFPNYTNVNSNHQSQIFKKEPYVLVFALNGGESIQIDSVERIYQIEDR